MFFTVADYDFIFNVEFHRRIPATGAVVSSVNGGENGDGAAKRRRALKLVDRALSKRQYKSALSLVKQLQGKPYGLRAFGAAKQVISLSLSLCFEFERSSVKTSIDVDNVYLQILIENGVDNKEAFSNGRTRAQ